jgi:hypothetical protein
MPSRLPASQAAGLSSAQRSGGDVRHLEHQQRVPPGVGHPAEHHLAELLGRIAEPVEDLLLVHAELPAGLDDLPAGRLAETATGCCTRQFTMRQPKIPYRRANRPARLPSNAVEGTVKDPDRVRACVGRRAPESPRLRDMTTAISERPARIVAQDFRSPGLGAADLGAAYEIKFQVSVAEAAEVEAWARRHLTPDPHGNEGSYRTVSVYCDTPNLDVYFRAPRFKGSKLRLRRYGASESVFLELKTKRGDRVRKRRVEVPPAELSQLGGAEAAAGWPGAWFLRAVRTRNFCPVCRVGYRRTAFFGRSGDTPVRMTIDRDLLGAPAAGWSVPPVETGVPLLAGGALVELKFHLHLPPLFRELLPRLPAQTARASKFRRCIELCGLLPAGVAPAAPEPPSRLLT